MTTSKYELAHIPKLENEGENYFDWAFHMVCLIKAHGSYAHITGESTKPVLAADRSNQTAVDDWEKDDNKLKMFISGTICTRQLRHIYNEETAYRMWNKLQQFNSNCSTLNKNAIMHSFLGYSLKDETKPTEAYYELEEIVINLENIALVEAQTLARAQGSTVPTSVPTPIQDDQFIAKVLEALPKKFHSLKQAFYNRPLADQNKTNLLASLKTEENTLKNYEAKEAEALKSVEKSEEKRENNVAFVARGRGGYRGRGGSHRGYGGQRGGNRSSGESQNLSNAENTSGNSSGNYYRGRGTTRRNKRGGASARGDDNSSHDHEEDDNCFLCGRPGHYKRDCPFTCRRCGKRGHFVADCRQPGTRSGNDGGNEEKTAFTISQEEDNLRWISDSGASQHITGHKQWLRKYVEFDKPKKLYMANHKFVLGEGQGEIDILYETSGQWKEATIYNVLYVKDAVNLFSEKQMADRGYQIVRDKEKAVYTHVDSGKSGPVAVVENGLYVMKFAYPEETFSLIACNDLFPKQLKETKKTCVSKGEKKSRQTEKNKKQFVDMKCKPFKLQPGEEGDVNPEEEVLGQEEKNESEEETQSYIAGYDIEEEEEEPEYKEEEYDYEEEDDYEEEGEEEASESEEDTYYQGKKVNIEKDEEEGDDSGGGGESGADKEAIHEIKEEDNEEETFYDCQVDYENKHGQRLSSTSPPPSLSLHLVSNMKEKIKKPIRGWTKKGKTVKSRFLQKTQKEEEEVKNDDKPTSKGHRKTKKKKSNVWLMVALFFMYVIMHTTSTDTQQAVPVIWRRTTTPITNGLEDLKLKFNLYSPCDLMNTEYFHDDLFDQAVAQCRQYYDNMFLKEVEKFCPTSNWKTQDHTIVRRKRFIIIGLFLLVAVCAGTGITGTALGFEALSQVSDLSDKVDNFYDEFCEMKAKFNQTVEKLAKLQGDYDMLKGRSISSSYVVSYITSQLVSGSYIIKETARQWRKGKVHNPFLDFLNVTLPCGEDCPLELAEAIHCGLSYDRKKLYMHVRIPRINRDLILVKPDPFTLMKKTKNETCSMTFYGVKNSIMSLEKECVMGMNIADDRNDLMIFPREGCLKPSSIPNTEKYYSTQICKKSHKNDEQEFVQVKRDGPNIYIYCPGGEVEIGGHPHSCPHYVFVIPMGTSFKINGATFEVSTITQSYNVTIDPSITLKTNLYLKPRVNWTELMLPHHKNITYEDGEGISGWTWFWGSLALILKIALVICICLWCYFSCRNRGKETTTTAATDEMKSEAPVTSPRRITQQYEKP